jgi:hypothetical protein
MRQKKILIFLVLVIFLTPACLLGTNLGGEDMVGSGDVASETRPVSGFDEISVCCGMRLILTQGDEESLEIEADDNLLPEILSEVSGGKLVVRYKDLTGEMNYRPTQPVVVSVTAIEIRGLELSGGGNLECAQIVTDGLNIDLSGGSWAEIGTLETDRLDIGISGGGEFNAQSAQTGSLKIDMSGGSRASIETLDGSDVTVGSSGGGTITLAGSATEQNIDLSGASSYRAGDLQSESAIVRMSGGGNATVWVSELLDVNLSGGADVEYYGSPRINENVSGGGGLQSLGEK